MYGLITSDGKSPIKKPWRVDSDVLTFARYLDRKCDGTHQHALCDGKHLRATQSYTKELVGCVHKAWQLFTQKTYQQKDGVRYGMVAVRAQAAFPRFASTAGPLGTCKQAEYCNTTRFVNMAHSDEEPYEIFEANLGTSGAQASEFEGGERGRDRPRPPFSENPMLKKSWYDHKAKIYQNDQ